MRFLHRPVRSFEGATRNFEQLEQFLVAPTATLVAGTVTVPNRFVSANSAIMLTAQDNLSTGALRVSARVAGVSFTITSSNVGDTGVVAYQIL